MPYPCYPFDLNTLFPIDYKGQEVSLYTIGKQYELSDHINRVKVILIGINREEKTIEFEYYLSKRREITRWDTWMTSVLPDYGPMLMPQDWGSVTPIK